MLLIHVSLIVQLFQCSVTSLLKRTLVVLAPHEHYIFFLSFLSPLFPTYLQRGRAHLHRQNTKSGQVRFTILSCSNVFLLHCVLPV